jgi:glycosyltransferase involved in cell wall biosynthesis
LPKLINEIAEALRPLIQHRNAEMSPLQGFEIVVVDDGSTDNTRERLRDLRLKYRELRTVFLAESGGQSAALTAGFHYARGDWIATLDGDLQNDPADLVALWTSLPGHDAVLGWRVDRHDTRVKRIISYWANRALNFVLGQSIRDTGCSVRIFAKAAALRLPEFDGVHRFLGPLLSRQGCRVMQVPVSHRPRCYGKSHYNLINRSFKVMIDLAGVAWLMRRPIRLARADVASQGPLAKPDIGGMETKQGL